MRLLARTAVAAAVAALLGALALAQAPNERPGRDALISASQMTVKNLQGWAMEYLDAVSGVAGRRFSDPLQIVIEMADGGEQRLNLDNVWADLQEVPFAERERVLADYEAGYAEMFSGAFDPAAASAASLMPIVRHRAYLEEGYGHLTDEAGYPAFREIAGAAGEIVEILAYDSPMTISVAPRDVLAENGIEGEAGFALAAENLARFAADLEWVDDGWARMAVLDGNYESSLLVLPELWDELEADMGGPLVAAAPARDLLVVVRADDPAAIETLRLLAADFVLDNRGVSAQLFARRAGRWEVLGGK